MSLGNIPDSIKKFYDVIILLCILLAVGLSYLAYVSLVSDGARLAEIEQLRSDVFRVGKDDDFMLLAEASKANQYIARQKYLNRSIAAPFISNMWDDVKPIEVRRLFRENISGANNEL